MAKTDKELATEMTIALATNLLQQKNPNGTPVWSLKSKDMVTIFNDIYENLNSKL